MNQTTVKIFDLISCYMQTNYNHKYCILVSMNGNKKLQRLLYDQYDLFPGLNSTTVYSFNDEQEVLRTWNKVKSIKEIKMSLWYRGIFQDKNK